MMAVACCIYNQDNSLHTCWNAPSELSCVQTAESVGKIGKPHPIEETRCEYISCPSYGNSIPCCVPIGTSGYPCVSVPGLQCWEDYGGTGHPGATSGSPWCPEDDPGLAPCWPEEPAGACCHLSGLCTDNVSEEGCVAQNAVWQGADTSCLTVDCPEYQARCRQGQSEPRSAVDEFGQPLREWTTDLCAVAFFAPVLRPPEHQPAPFEEGDEPGFLPGEGDFELLSVNPVRAMMVDMPNNQSDPCVRHYAKMARLANGDFGAAYCSQPGANAREDRQIHLGDLYCQPDGEDPDAVLPPGDCAFVGLYHTPFWTEALYHSEAPVCGGMSQ